MSIDLKFLESELEEDDIPKSFARHNLWEQEQKEKVKKMRKIKVSSGTISH